MDTGTDVRIVTLIAPESFEPTIEKALLELGAEGFTAFTVRGYGQHGHRPSQWTRANVRVEVIVRPEAAPALIAALKERFPRELGVFLFEATARIP